MIYTAVFQNSKGVFAIETHVAPHDRSKAWREIYEKREDVHACLVLLIDGQASVNTFNDVVDVSQ
jgi:hypothetical protein